MSWTDTLVSSMKTAGASVNPSSISIGVMASANSCTIKDGLTIPNTMLYFADHLVNQTAVKVAGTCPKDGGSLSDKSTYLSALQAGDKVAVYRVDDAHYIILARLVQI